MIPDDSLQASVQDQHENLGKKRAKDVSQQAIYDFDRYEMMSTTNQIQDLLSKKLDTPKGSSGSDQPNDNDNTVDMEDQFAKVITTRVTSSNQQTDHSRKMHPMSVNLSPEPTKKPNNNALLYRK